jgi:hypothetical protein
MIKHPASFGGCLKELTKRLLETGVSGIAGGAVSASIYGVIGGIGVAAAGTAVSVTLAPLIAIGSVLGVSAYGLYWLGSAVTPRRMRNQMIDGNHTPRSIWDELTDAVAYIREQFAANKIRLVKDEGITKALDEAEALGRGRAEGPVDVTKPLLTSVEECHVILAFARDLRLCVRHGLPVGPHLRRMTSGSTDFGVPSGPNERNYFFKDFETELFVAATLAQAGFPVRFLEHDNDPRGEMEIEGLLIEVKHPDSPSSTSRHLRKFSDTIRYSGAPGFFIRSVEDAFELASGVALSSDVVQREWEEKKTDEMEANGMLAVQQAFRLGNILGFATLASHLEVVGNESRFIRKGRAVVFDRAAEQQGRLDLVMRIAQALDKDPTQWSSIVPEDR